MNNRYDKTIKKWNEIFSKDEVGVPKSGKMRNQSTEDWIQLFEKYFTVKANKSIHYPNQEIENRLFYTYNDKKT